VRGETARHNFELVPAAADAGVQPLAAFVVRTEHEGKAKALMEQRRSMNLTNSLSSDVFGDVAEGRGSEFVKNVPGAMLILSAAMRAARACAASILSTWT
jgi:hypothetical protein